MPRIGVVGAGAWGTALAVTAARSGHQVELWGRDRSLIERVAAARENPAYLAGVALPEAVRPTPTLAELAGTDALLLAVPAQMLRPVLSRLPPTRGPLVITAKGLEQATGLRMSEVVLAERPGSAVAALSGPSFAREVGLGLPTAVTIAAADLELARFLAELLASPAFRPYPSDDLLGVELAGALKNVVAIAAGVTMGKGLGENARASLITRGLAELTRLALALGARRETLMGLAGLGDLLLTATSLTSRNTSFGFALAKGRSAGELLAAGEKLSEGAFTAEAACRLGRRAGVDLPIAEAVRGIVAGEIDVDTAIGALLARPLPLSE
ncbi:MAG: NAD(P)H-dependent glycerol-3-phosphate dehydrogenase [Geminicoccaceae bacterium]